MIILYKWLKVNQKVVMRNVSEFIPHPVNGQAAKVSRIWTTLNFLYHEESIWVQNQIYQQNILIINFVQKH